MWRGRRWRLPLRRGLCLQCTAQIPRGCLFAFETACAMPAARAPAAAHTRGVPLHVRLCQRPAARRRGAMLTLAAWPPGLPCHSSPHPPAGLHPFPCLPLPCAAPCCPSCCPCCASARLSSSATPWGLGWRTRPPRCAPHWVRVPATGHRALAIMFCPACQLRASTVHAQHRSTVTCCHPPAATRGCRSWRGVAGRCPSRCTSPPTAPRCWRVRLILLVGLGCLFEVLLQTLAPHPRQPLPAAGGCAERSGCLAASSASLPARAAAALRCAGTSVRGSYAACRSHATLHRSPYHPLAARP